MMCDNSMCKMAITNDPLGMLTKQLDNFYGISKAEILQMNEIYPHALKKLELCFSFVKNKYYNNNGSITFNPLHVGQWSQFLYQMSRLSVETELSDKIYGLSKMVSSADIFYGIEMPDIWFFDHPQGSVLGRAKYSNFFTFSQGCTVGNNKGVYPIIGEHVSMFSNSKILGNCNIEDHVIFAANTYLLDQDIPSYSIVFGMSPNIVVKSITAEKFNELTGSMFDAEATYQ